ALAANRPQLVAQVLLEEWNLGLHREHDLRQTGCRPVVWRHAGQHPRAAFLIHEPARAVERIDEQPPAAVSLTRSPRQHEGPARDAFGDNTQRLLPAEVAEAAHERILPDAVDGVDRVALGAAIVTDGRELL